MKLFKYNNILPAVALTIASFGMIACTGDLDVENINPQQVASNNNDAMFTKIYANLVLTGQTGPDGNCDIEGLDEGMSNLLRQVWNANELTTDEAHCTWGDAGIPEYNNNKWTDTHPMMNALYYRLFFGVTISNYYLQEVSGSDAETLAKRAEARFMRALYYYYLMDFYGNPPFMTSVSTEKGEQTTRAELFKFIVNELKDVVGEGEGSEILKDAKTNTYGRADKAAAWMLLARLYLNSEVYCGEAHYDLAKSYADKVIASGYKLCDTPKGSYNAYQLLFMADNDSNGAQDEIILPAIHDGERTQTWGGMLFLIASTVNSDIATDYPVGTTEGWSGNNPRHQFVLKFFPSDNAPVGTPTEVAAAANDDRALFFTYIKDGDDKKARKSEIDTESDFNEPYCYVKFSNLRSDGAATTNTRFVDTDFPIFRVAEAYLTYAEADARLNGGNCTSEGLQKIKDLRTRAHAYNSLATFSLDEILDEWSREFGFEGRRRTDLVRFGRFGGQSKYTWEWMGGTKEGQQFPAYRNIFAIPQSDITANGNLKQNEGY